LSHRQPLDLVEDDDGAMVVIEGVEKSRQNPTLLAPLEVRVLGGFDPYFRRLRDDLLATTPLPPPMRRGDAHANLTYPGPQTRAAFELRVATMHDHEDILRCVVEICLGHPEVTQGSPDCPCMFIEYLAKRRADEASPTLLGGPGGNLAHRSRHRIMRRWIHAITHIPDRNVSEALWFYDARYAAEAPNSSSVLAFAQQKLAEVSDVAPA
jgi:hypothetical protein